MNSCAFEDKISKSPFQAPSIDVIGQEKQALPRESKLFQDRRSNSQAFAATHKWIDCVTCASSARFVDWRTPASCPCLLTYYLACSFCFVPCASFKYLGYPRSWRKVNSVFQASSTGIAHQAKDTFHQIKQTSIREVRRKKSKTIEVFNSQNGYGYAHGWCDGQLERHGN